MIKFLAACLAALGASLPAAAVYLSGSGMGQALIYPYYTVRSTEGNAFNTLAGLSGNFIPESGADCSGVRTGSAFPALAAPSGYLYGSLTLINVQSGLDFTVPADALAQLATAAYYRAPADPYPDFTANEIGRVASFTLDNKLYRIEMPTSVGAVEAALVRANIVNEIALDPVTASTTDWVITLPTRRFHAAGLASPWYSAALLQRSAPTMRGRYVSRTGTAVNTEENCGFLCLPNTYEVDVRVPWAATVLGFTGSNALRPTAGAGTTAALGSTNGWNVSLPNAGPGGGAKWSFYSSYNGVPTTTLNAVTTRLDNGATANERIELEGLPATGFMVRTLRNGTLACAAGSCQGNYGGSLSHRMRRSVRPAQ